MRTKIVVIMTIVAILFVSVVLPASAQSEVPYIVTFSTLGYSAYTFGTGTSFSSSDGNPSPSAITSYQYNPGGGLVWRIEVLVDLPSSCTLTDIDMDYKRDAGAGNITVAINVFDPDDVVLYTDGFSDFAGVGTWSTWDGLTGSQAGGSYISYVAEIATSNSSAPRLDNLAFVCDGLDGGGGFPSQGPFEPIRNEDQIEHIEGVAESGLFFTASRISAKVEEADLSRDGFHEVRVYASHGGEIEQVYYANGAFNIRYTENEDDGREVSIIYGNLAEVFVQPGDVVTAGCVIGLAGPQYAPLDSSGYDAAEVRQIDYAAAEDNVYENWTLYDNPSGTASCGGNQSTQNCMNNDPRFTSGKAFWGTAKLDDYAALSRDVTFDDGAVTLPNGYYLHQEFIVEGAPEAVIITIVASVPKFSVGKLRASFGDAVEIVPLAYDGQMIGTQLVKITGELTAATPTIDPDIYSLEIANVSGAGRDVVINFVCLSPADEPALIAPSACYFNQDGLIHPNDDGDPSNNWELSESPDPVAEIIRVDNLISQFYALKLPEEAYASYPLILPAFVDEETEYVLTLRGRQNPPIGTSSSYLGIDIDSSSFTGSDEVEINGLSVDLGLAPVPEYRFTLEPDEPITDGTLTLTANTLGTFIDDIYITTACLYPANGVWPGYEDADWSWSPVDPADPFPDNQPGTLPPGIGSFACLAGIPPLPSGIDVPEWLKWLGAFINWIFDCKFMPVFETALEAIKDIADTLGKMMLWFSITLRQFAKWMIKLVDYLALSLAGLLFEAIEGLWDAIINLDLIKALYDQLAIGALLFSTLMGLASSVVAGLLYVVRTLTTFAELIINLFVAIFAGLNSSSTVDVGLPNCGVITSEDSWYAFCGMLNLAEYTFDQFPSLLAPVGVIIAALAYITFSTAKEWIGEAFAESG